MRGLLLSFALLAGLTAPAAIAQATPAACEGTVTRVRLSEVKKGMMSTFEQAVAANLAWYRGKGVTSNQIFMSKIMDLEPGKGYVLSPTQVMTFHYNPPQATGSGPAQDDAYKAFVKLYNDSSTIKLEYTVCMPKMQM